MKHRRKEPATHDGARLGFLRANEIRDGGCIMKTLLTLLSVFVLSALTVAQTHIATGTVIPGELNSTINAKNCKAGQMVEARVAQDVPLDNGNRIKAGTRIMGEILAVRPAEGFHPAMVALRFNNIDISGRSTPTVSNLRALASPLEVDAAQTQISGDDRGSTPPWSQTLIRAVALVSSSFFSGSGNTASTTRVTVT